ncbi:hypothetical protein ACOME3_010215 [Neoechinorhynchus agilis]
MDDSNCISIQKQKDDNILLCFERLKKTSHRHRKNDLIELIVKSMHPDYERYLRKRNFCQILFHCIDSGFFFSEIFNPSRLRSTFSTRKEKEIQLLTIVCNNLNRLCCSESSENKLEISGEDYSTDEFEEIEYLGRECPETVMIEVRATLHELMTLIDNEKYVDTEINKRNQQRPSETKAINVSSNFHIEQNIEPIVRQTVNISNTHCRFSIQVPGMTIDCDSCSSSDLSEHEMELNEMEAIDFEEDCIDPEIIGLQLARDLLDVGSEFLVNESVSFLIRKILTWLLNLADNQSPRFLKSHAVHDSLCKIVTKMFQDNPKLIGLDTILTGALLEITCLAERNVDRGRLMAVLRGRVEHFFRNREIFDTWAINSRLHAFILKFVQKDESLRGYVIQELSTRFLNKVDMPASGILLSDCLSYVKEPKEYENLEQFICDKNVALAAFTFKCSILLAQIIRVCHRFNGTLEKAVALLSIVLSVPKDFPLPDLITSSVLLDRHFVIEATLVVVIIKGISFRRVALPIF